MNYGDLLAPVTGRSIGNVSNRHCSRKVQLSFSAVLLALPYSMSCLSHRLASPTVARCLPTATRATHFLLHIQGRENVTSYNEQQSSALETLELALWLGQCHALVCRTEEVEWRGVTQRGKVKWMPQRQPECRLQQHNKCLVVDNIFQSVLFLRK